MARGQVRSDRRLHGLIGAIPYRARRTHLSVGSNVTRIACCAILDDNPTRQPFAANQDFAWGLNTESVQYRQGYIERNRKRLDAETINKR